MGDEINELKSVLRSLVVSSPTQMDVRTLMRDYRNMMGAPVPHIKYGHRNPVAFLQERFSDCFLFAGSPSNPVLTLIVPDTLKHIDQFVQRQRVPSTAKFKLKRRSIPETVVNPPAQNLVSKTFNKRSPIIEEPKKPEVKAPDITNDTNHSRENVHNHDDPSNALKNFLKKRLPMYNSLPSVNGAPSTSADKDGTLSVSQDDDSGKHTSSTSNSTKALQFEELKSEIMELIAAAPQGVWCTDLIRLYRERYQRELNFTRFGYTSIVSLAYALERRVHISRPEVTGDWLLRERGAPAPPTPRPRRNPARLVPRAPAPQPAPLDADDALPGIDYDPDVFPEDCLHFMESIPTMTLEDCRTGAMLEVIVGEVYSPSHFWIIRLGDHYNIAMEDMMDDMTRYYNGEGRARVLSRGAIRVGHFCSSLYDNDWHRSLIVKIVDSDTVKVRHVDYGTVDVVGTDTLRPLRREWARLPAQAVRARLAGVRPSAAGRRWPHAAATHFLRLVQDTRLVANVVAVDLDAAVLEVLLIDTTAAADLCLSDELVRAGFADLRPDSALQTAECYLYPRFEALETGATPNYSEIHAYLRDGIALDYVDAYRLHVPVCLPPAAPPARASTPARAPPPPTPPSPVPAPAPPVTPPAPASPPPTRIPLLWPAASPPDPCPSPEPPPRPASTPRTLPATEQAPATAPTLSASAQPFCPQPAFPQPAFPQPAFPQSQPAYPRPPATFHPSGMYPLAGVYPPPPGAQPAGQWFGPYPTPLPPGGVTLRRDECETYHMLARVNPAAAHWFMAGALGRAMVAPRPPPPGAPGGMLAPPGFGG